MESNSDSITTPKFLLWSIPQACSVKDSLVVDFDDQVDLLQVERTFRPLRSIAMAFVEKRVIDDLCILQSPDEKNWSLKEIKAFSTTEALDAFGGEQFLANHCGCCEANVYSNPTELTSAEPNPSNEKQFAGCYGYLQSIHDDWNLFQWWQEQINQNSATWNCHQDFQLDEIWRSQSNQKVRNLKPPYDRLLLNLLDLVPASHRSHADIRGLHNALIHTLNAGTQLQIQVIPQAQIVERNWIVPQHCSSCIEPVADWNGRCPNCLTENPPNPKRKRQLRGDRPYWPLIRFLGEAESTKVAETYFDHSGSSQMPELQ